MVLVPTGVDCKAQTKLYEVGLDRLKYRESKWRPLR